MKTPLPRVEESDVQNMKIVRRKRMSVYANAISTFTVGSSLAYIGQAASALVLDVNFPWFMEEYKTAMTKYVGSIEDLQILHVIVAIGLEYCNKRQMFEKKLAEITLPEANQTVDVPDDTCKISRLSQFRVPHVSDEDIIYVHRRNTVAQHLIETHRNQPMYRLAVYAARCLRKQNWDWDVPTFTKEYKKCTLMTKTKLLETIRPCVPSQFHHLLPKIEQKTC